MLSNLDSLRNTHAYKKMIIRMEHLMLYPEEVSCGNTHNIFSNSKCYECDLKLKQLDDKLDIIIKDKDVANAK